MNAGARASSPSAWRISRIHTLIADSLTVYANVGLLETEFERYINADGDDLSGREQAHAPSYQYALGGRYDLGAGFYLRADLEGKVQKAWE